MDIIENGKFFFLKVAPSQLLPFTKRNPFWTAHGFVTDILCSLSVFLLFFKFIAEELIFRELSRIAENESFLEETLLTRFHMNVSNESQLNVKNGPNVHFLKNMEQNLKIV